MAPLVSHSGQPSGGNPTDDYTAISIPIWLTGSGSRDDQEIIVHSDAKEKIRTTLEKMGISGKTLFSDLLGFFERNSAAQPYNLTVDALGD